MEIYLEKIPSELRLIISRKFGSKETWDLDALLYALKSELEARERCNAVKTSTQSILTLDLTCRREDSNNPFPHLHFMQAVKSVLCNVSYARKITSPSPVVPLLSQRLEELF